MLLPIEVDLIIKKQSRKKDVLVACSTGYMEIIFALLTKVVAFYLQVFIKQVKVSGLEKRIIEYKVCLTMFLTFKK